jgi:hypothetical protein
MVIAFRIIVIACLPSLLAIGAVSAGDAPPTAAANAESHLGVYRWANKPANVDAFADWLGRPTA